MGLKRYCAGCLLVNSNGPLFSLIWHIVYFSPKPDRCDQSSGLPVKETREALLACTTKKCIRQSSNLFNFSFLHHFTPNIPEWHSFFHFIKTQPNSCPNRCKEAAPWSTVPAQSRYSQTNPQITPLLPDKQGKSTNIESAPTFPCPPYPTATASYLTTSQKDQDNF